MEFLVFALLNLVTGLVLYVLFSLRMQAWQNKIRAAHPLQKDVEENIRQGLQAMNAYLEEMQEIRANFYQLVRHAEDLKKEETRKPRKKKREEPELKSLLPEEEEQEDHVSRILDKIGPDTVDLTRPAASQPRSQPLVQEPEPSAGILQGIGRFAASIFGVKTDPFAASIGKATPAEEALSIDVPQPTIRPPVSLNVEPARESVGLPSASDSTAASAPITQDPNAWIRSLLAGGMKAADVSRVTGRSLAEIDLIGSLPSMPPEPRRKKLGD
ncbi:MAG TPA: hypothetical protein PK881_02530 [Leptospiraceae bacterium]|nr:hypothetical protein [Leptospiraceae bacterium]